MTEREFEQMIRKAVWSNRIHNAITLLLWVGIILLWRVERERVAELRELNVRIEMAQDAARYSHLPLQ